LNGDGVEAVGDCISGRILRFIEEWETWSNEQVIVCALSRLQIRLMWNRGSMLLDEDLHCIRNAPGCTSRSSGNVWAFSVVTPGVRASLLINTFAVWIWLEDLFVYFLHKSFWRVSSSAGQPQNVRIGERAIRFAGCCLCFGLD
jgi:hypothetical protein